MAEAPTELAEALGFGAPAAPAYLAGRARRAARPRGGAPLPLLAVTAAGVYATVPDVEAPLLVLGATLPAALLAVLPALPGRTLPALPGGTLGAPGALAWAGLL